MLDWTTIIRRKISWKELDGLQESCVAEVQAAPDRAFLLISEPEATFTSGLSADAGDLLWNEDELRRNHVAVERVARGGRWTFHGPGQIVLYPIVKLERLGYASRAAHGFLNDLRQSVVDTLGEMGVVTTTSDEPFGVFCGGKKIVSFGIGIRRGVVSSGLALYYDNQDAYFKGIHPCGIRGAPTTNLLEQGVTFSWDQSAERLADHVKKSFKSSKN